MGGTADTGTGQEHGHSRPQPQVRFLKRLLWELRADADELWLWLLCAVPLRLGVWLRARLLPRVLGHLGPHARVLSGFRVTSADKVHIGAHCNFAQNVFITGGGGVRIGDWVGFGPDVKVWSVNHRFDDPDTPWQLQGWDEKEVVIEDDVWLGAGVFVMPGVTIRRGAIISACTVLNKSVPAYAIVAGNPGRVVGWRKRPPADASESNAAPAAADPS
jgi:acetyltransferase-like isoleucine patch superfamily enzyme